MEEGGSQIESKELEPQGNETVLIFGQGPVIIEPNDRVNYWSEDLAKAAAALKEHDPRIKNFVVMGGQTGGPGHASEANLISQKMRDLGLGSEEILEEGQSNDTIENIVNFLNIIDSTEITKNTFDILCSPYHSVRTQVLVGLFQIPVKNVFQSTEVLRFVGRATKEGRLTTDSDSWNNQLLDEIEDKINLNNPTKYSSKQSTHEQRDVLDRYIKDDLWTRELIEFPEKWLPYIGRLTDGERITRILNQINQLYPGMLQEKYNISPEDIENPSLLPNIKAALLSIPPYTGLSAEKVSQWVTENKTTGWPIETQAILNQILSQEPKEN